MIAELEGEALDKITLQGRIDDVGDQLKCFAGASPQELVHHPRLKFVGHRIKVLQHGSGVGQIGVSGERAIHGNIISDRGSPLLEIADLETFLFGIVLVCQGGRLELSSCQRWRESRARKTGILGCDSGSRLKQANCIGEGFVGIGKGKVGVGDGRSRDVAKDCL